MTNSKSGPTKLVFDIETAPLLADAYTPLQIEIINKKLDNALRLRPNLDQAEEIRKIKSIDPFLGRIVCIGLYSPDDDRAIGLHNDANEKDILKNFWKILAEFDGTFISYNGVKFDVPFILKRSMIHGLLPTNKNFLNYTSYNSFPPHFDVMLQMAGRDGYISLETAAEMFGVKSSKTGGVKAKNVAEAFYGGRTAEIVEYCIADTKCTYDVFKIVKNYVYSKY